ncbi:MAG: tyrosine--tRNA ligase [Alphaproteobacteria bacterium]|nr:tyrosine--tRNA ligase [Alphaproteobacteria bacterium]
MTEKLFEMLQARGFVKDITHADEIRAALNSDKKITFYVGLDPTADSLHIGHFFALRMLRHIQNAGHRGIVIIGGATAMIGDPSGRSDMRTMITPEQIKHNIAEVRKLAERFVLPDTIILDNAEWLNKFNYVDFLRLVCVHFNMNTMLAADAYKKRREEGGLTFLEMGYMPMQAFDFVHLNKEHDCVLQIGGSDQWGNIVAGVELYRKMNIGNPDAGHLWGMTAPLLMTTDGEKMGKTAKGAIWVASDRTTPYDFYQYFYNTMDADCKLLLALFTDIPMDEIDAIIADDIVLAKKRMAFEVTKLIHGEAIANDVVGGRDSAAIPTIELEPKNATLVVSILVDAKIFSSKSEARRTIEQGGLKMNDVIVDNADLAIITTGEYMFQKGKKTFLKVIIK